MSSRRRSQRLSHLGNRTSAFDVLLDMPPGEQRDAMLSIAAGEVVSAHVVSTNGGKKRTGNIERGDGDPAAAFNDHGAELYGATAIRATVEQRLLEEPTL